MKDYMQQVLAALDVAASGDLPKPVERGHSLVLHLGFDSLKMALLSLALEGQLGCPIVLDEWIASHGDPNDLTVGSLCGYLEEALREHGSQAVSQ